VTRPKSTSSNATANAAESKTRKQRATTLYPKVSLIDALRLAESIRDNKIKRAHRDGQRLTAAIG
jgi:hypothetical protein